MARRNRGRSKPASKAPAPDSQAASTPTMNLASLWSTEYNRFQSSRQRIRVAGQWRRNEVLPRVPWDQPEAFHVMLPHATTMGQAVANFLARRRPQVHRTPLGSDPRAERISSRIENWLQPLLEDELQSGGEALWDANLAFAVHDGEWGVIVQPDTTHWDELLDYTVAEDGRDVIAPHFQRDAKGRAPDDPYYTNPNVRDRKFTLNKDRSATAFKDYQADAKAREVPFVVRLIPADQCVPIGIDPQTGGVDAMLIRSDRTAISLKRDGFDAVLQGPGVSPGSIATSLGQGASAIAGSGTLYSLYELWMADDEGCKVWYQVGSSDGSQAYETTRYGKTDVCLDLAAKYPGFFKNVPGGYFFGCHFANETDPNKKAYPFIYVFLSLLRGANQTLSAKVAHMYLTAFAGWNARLSAEDVETWHELGSPVDLAVKPGQVNFVVGELTPAVHPGTGKDVDEFIQMALSVLRELGPEGNAPSSDQSGFSQGVSIATSDAAFGQLTRGAQMAMECIAECLLEQCAAISQETGAPVPVYAHTDAKTGSKQDHVELSADDLEGDYEVDILLPTPKWSNLALAQAGAGFVKDNLIPRVTWLEEMAGFENPERIEDLKWVQTQMDSEAGQMQTLELAAKYSGEVGLQKFQKLLQAGKVTPGGTPASMVPPRPTGADAAGPTGANTGNPAASALAGIAGGPSMTGPQAAVIQATGQPAPVAV